MGEWAWAVLILRWPTPINFVQYSGDYRRRRLSECALHIAGPQQIETSSVPVCIERSNQNWQNHLEWSGL